MSRATSKPTALRLPISTSPVVRRAHVSPLHSMAPKFRDDDDDSSSSEVDTNLEEDLLMEIRTLVRKEKYLGQLEDQLREQGDDIEDSSSDKCELYDEQDEVLVRRAIPKAEKLRAKSSNEPKDRAGEDVTKMRSVPAREISNKFAWIAREHYRACFVEVNPVQLREIRALILPSQDLQIQHLRTLSKNLFLFSALKSVNLSNNQLDDSGSKEIRDLMCCPGLQALDISRNLFGRLTARTIYERLRHQTKLLSLDLHGNLFFSDGGEIAGEIARLFAKAVAVNESLLHFCLSVPDQLEKSAPLGDQWAHFTSRSQVKHKKIKGKSAEITSAATEFSQHLVEQLRQHGTLQSLGLCYAEISRRVVLNTVKMANRLTTLDLSFAFIGIPGAQVVAAALRIDDYATLTQLNLHCNRTKSMGARAILAALNMNERLTSLNLSHNEIRSDTVDAVVELLSYNKVITRLDLSQNELIADDTQQTEAELRCLHDAIVEHRALLSLGKLNSLGANEDQERELQGVLDKNRIADDHDILNSINAVSVSKPTDEDGPSRKRHMISTIIELDDAASLTTAWQREVTEDGRLSLKWRMAVRTKQAIKASVSEDTGDASHRGSLVWKLVVNRKCEVRGLLDDEAATEHFNQDEPGSSYTLHSAVAYCDKGDTISLKLGIDHEYGREDAKDAAKQRYKVFIKDVVFIPHHPQDRRHLLLSIPQSFSGTPVQWRMKTQRTMPSSKNQDTDPSSFLWEGVVQRVYIHTTGVYRLLTRVQYPTKVATTNEEKMNILKSRYWWQLQRSSCWNPHTNHIVLEGSYLDLHGVLRNSRDVVFYLPAMEWMAGEYLHLSVTTPSDDIVLRVTQFQVFHDVLHPRDLLG